ncbi:MAG: MFS transporter [Vicinamibacterales bacterium]
MPNLRALAVDLTPLRARDYRLLYIGQFVSLFGTAISYVVLPVQMYALTHSSLAVGLLGVAEFVPTLVLAFVGGALADAMDRRRLILAAEIGMALCCVALAANAASPAPAAWVLFVCSALVAGLNAVHRPALEALTPRLVPLEQMPAVAALQAIRYNTTFIIGPGLAGLIVSSLGATVAYAIDAVTFAASLAAVFSIQSVTISARAEKPSLHAVREAWRYARSRQELIGTYVLDIIAMFFGMPIALFPAIAEQFPGAAVGWFYSMMAVGPLLVSATSGWTARVHRHGLAIVLAVIVWGVAIVLFGLATNLWFALVMLALAGAADNVSGLFRMTIWNQTIPDRLRGRMASIEMLSYLTGPYLGNAEAGLVASAFGLRTSVVSGGVLCVVGAVIAAVLLPTFVQYDGREGAALKRDIDAADNAFEASER